VQKVFPYDPTLIHNTSYTDKQTDERQWYHRRLQHSCRGKHVKNVYSIDLIINVREQKFQRTEVPMKVPRMELSFPGFQLLPEVLRLLIWMYPFLHTFLIANLKV